MFLYMCVAVHGLVAITAVLNKQDDHALKSQLRYHPAIAAIILIDYFAVDFPLTAVAFVSDNVERFVPVVVNTILSGLLYLAWVAYAQIRLRRILIGISYGENARPKK